MNLSDKYNYYEKHKLTIMTYGMNLSDTSARHCDSGTCSVALTP